MGLDFSWELKRKALWMVLDGGRTCAESVRETGIPDGLLYKLIRHERKKRALEAERAPNVVAAEKDQRAEVRRLNKLLRNRRRKLADPVERGARLAPWTSDEWDAETPDLDALGRHPNWEGLVETVAVSLATETNIARRVERECARCLDPLLVTIRHVTGAFHAPSGCSGCLFSYYGMQKDASRAEDVNKRNINEGASFNVDARQTGRPHPRTLLWRNPDGEAAPGAARTGQAVR